MASSSIVIWSWSLRHEVIQQNRSSICSPGMLGSHHPLRLNGRGFSSTRSGCPLPDVAGSLYQWHGCQQAVKKVPPKWEHPRSRKPFTHLSSSQEGTSRDHCLVFAKTEGGVRAYMVPLRSSGRYYHHLSLRSQGPGGHV